MNAALTELDELEKEKNLWHLARILYLDEQSSMEMAHDANDSEEDEGMDVGIDEALLVQRLLRKNPVLRKIKLVIEWLEDISSQSKNVKLARQKIGEFSEKSQCWDHTLHHLKNQNSFNKKENYMFSNRDFVDELVINICFHFNLSWRQILVDSYDSFGLNVRQCVKKYKSIKNKKIE